MSAEALLFGLIGLVWMIAGLAMVAMPAWSRERLRRWMQEPGPRFLLIHAAMLNGLILMAGLSIHGSWLWMAVGAVFLVAALGLLSIAAPARKRLLDRWTNGPLWRKQVAGMVFVVLATLWLLDAWRHAP